MFNNSRLDSLSTREDERVWFTPQLKGFIFPTETCRKPALL
jgi:hypothetical protein